MTLGKSPGGNRILRGKTKRWGRGLQVSACRVQAEVEEWGGGAGWPAPDSKELWLLCSSQSLPSGDCGLRVDRSPSFLREAGNLSLM